MNVTKLTLAALAATIIPTTLFAAAAEQDRVPHSAPSHPTVQVVPNAEFCDLDGMTIHQYKEALAVERAARHTAEEARHTAQYKLGELEADLDAFMPFLKSSLPVMIAVVSDAQLKTSADAVTKIDITAAYSSGDDTLLNKLRSPETRQAAFDTLIAAKQDGDIQPALQELLHRLLLLDALGEHAAAINA